MEKVKSFFKKHWIDIIVIAAVLVLLGYLGYNIYYRFSFEKKWNIFYDYFFTNGGYKKLLLGMQNTALIAVLGLLIGSLIGTLIAIIKVIPLPTISLGSVSLLRTRLKFQDSYTLGFFPNMAKGIWNLAYHLPFFMKLLNMNPGAFHVRSTGWGIGNRRCMEE